MIPTRLGLTFQARSAPGLRSPSDGLGWAVIWFVFLLLTTMGFRSIAQTPDPEALVTAEYFWDNDPGPGLGTNVVIAVGESLGLGFPGAIPFNVGIGQLSVGLHQFGFRTRDANARWSEISWLPILVQDATTLVPSPGGFSSGDVSNQLISAEYAWDNGVPVSISIHLGESFDLGFPGTNLFNPGIAQLSAGLHQLGMRAQDASGRWSETNFLFVQVQDATTLIPSPGGFSIVDASNQLVSAEYAWDNGVPVVISIHSGESFDLGFPGTNLFNPAITQLSAGLHQLEVSAQDANGRWSETNFLLVQVQDATTLIPSPAGFSIVDASNQLVSAEFSWDNGPATNVTIPAAESFALGFPAPVPFNVGITQLNAGLHQLGFRAQDASGRWSETNLLAVQVQDANTLIPSPANFPITDSSNLLVFVEYFWDADPGLGNGVPVSFPAGETFIPGANPLPSLSIPVPHLPLGVHYLSLRARDTSGRWATNQTGIVLDRRTDFLLATAITLQTNSNTAFFTNISVSCPGPAQFCSNTFDLTISTESLLRTEFTSALTNCQDLRMHFLVDGIERAVSSRLTKGAASGMLSLGPVTNGTHLLQLQAEGFLGGCDVGALNSWGGSLQVVTSSLATNVAGGDFTHTAGLGMGLAVGDYNADGYADVFETFQDQSGVLMLNNRAGGLNRTNLPPSLGPAAGQTATWADYDNDGWLDLLVSTPDRTAATGNLLYRNLGGTNFALLAATNMPSAESNSVGTAWADIDDDGWVDFAIASGSSTRIELYRNNGNGSFTHSDLSSNLLSGAALAIAFADFDNDGYPDLVSAGPGGVHLFRNFTNHFQEITGSGLPNDATATSVSWADYDNDGWLDLFIVSSNHLGALYHNKHDWTFEQVQIPTFNVPGFVAATCAWADYDQDGRIDLFVSSGSTNYPNRLFHNNPDGIFDVITNGPANAPLGAYAGSAWADIDRNGTPDLLVASHGGTNLLYQNLGSGANWLRVKLSGRPSNRAAIGAKVRVLANIDGQSFWQLQEVSGGNGYGSQNELPLTFGLGDATNIDTVRIEWPSGLTTIFTNRAPNQVLAVPELIDGTPVISVNNIFQASGQYPFVSLNPVVVTIDDPYPDGFVFYTLDGSEPDFTANWYTAPFQISPPTTIRAIAYDAAFTTNAFSDPAHLILVPTFFLTNSTPGGGNFTLSPPGPNYLSNTLVTAVATNQAGWTFMGWAGDLSGNNPTNSFLMTSNKNVAAVFGTTISLTTLGGAAFGAAAVDPATNLYPYASIARLSSTPAAGKYFVSWALANPNLTFTNNPTDWPVSSSNASFIARLANLPTNTYSLTTLIEGNGGVTRSQYANFYTNGTAVTLTAVEANGQIFLGWSGDVTSPQNPLTVVMNSSKVLTANFGTNPPLFSFASPSYAANETDGSVSLTISNNGVAGTVTYSTLDGTAHGGNGSFGDYVSAQQSLTFAYLERSKTISIALRDNFLNGADKAFQVRLSNATGGANALGNPAVATVFIHDNDPINTNGSQLIQSYPAAPPAMNGSLQVVLTPPEASGQWRFPWQIGWRNGGDTVTNLEPGSYDLEFREIPGYLALPKPAATVDAVTPSFSTNQYFRTLTPDSLGSFRVDFAQNQPVGAAWRFRGEADWHPVDFVLTGLLPGSRTLEFATVPGYQAPAARPVLITANFVSETVESYQAHQLPANTSLPAPLFSFDQINVASTNSPRLPYVFNGQLWSPVNGFASGVVVRSNVVLTAAHVVFDYQSLAFRGPVYWFFQRQLGEFDPAPLKARGWNVLDGYAAARTVDRDTNHLTADESSASSRNEDVAALYFNSSLHPAGRGGFGGYLSSDASVNEWLTGAGQKMLVGYPIDSSADGYTNVIPGKMHATAISNFNFTPQNDRVYASSGFLNFPGNSGGPLYAQHSNGVFYPAAVLLGRQGDVSLVRAIDSNVVSLIVQAELKGDTGTNNTGGGVITFVSDQTLSAAVPAYVQVVYGPSSLLALGGWKLSDDLVYGTNTPADLYTRSVTNNSAQIQFRNVPGWDAPPNQSFQLAANKQNIISNQFYTLSATQSVSPATAFTTIGYAGGPLNVTNTTYSITNRGQGILLWSASPGANWLTLTPSSGSLSGSNSVTITASLNPAAYSLPVGSFTNLLSFINQTNGLGTTTRSFSLILSNHPPVGLSNFVRHADGSFSVALSGIAGRSYSVLMATNLIQPLSNWIAITAAVGQATFTIPPSPNDAQRYYRVKEL